MNLEKYKAENDLTNNDIIDLVKPEFPKFSKVAMSMVNKGTYGVVLAPKAVRVLSAAHPQKKEKRNRGNRITVWMNDFLYALFRTGCEERGLSMQELAETAIYTYLKPEARTAQPHELNSKPDKKLLMEIYDLKNELCLKCGNYQLAHHGACDGCRWEH